MPKGTDIFLSKITKPGLTGIYQRRRLFGLLDKALKKPAVWISGPAGMGKTTLVASWLDARGIPCLWYQIDESDADIATFFYYMGLAAKRAAPAHRKPLPLFTPEYLPGVTTFTRRYFENLFGRLKPPCITVLDNYQTVPVESGFHEMMREGLAMIPEGINVIVVSRSDPPPAFARLQANDSIFHVGYGELQFTLGESRKLIKTSVKEKISDSVVRELYGKTLGWAAGIVLIGEMAKRERIEPDAINKIIPDEIFDYFAGEIFDKTDSKTKDFLLKTSFLHRITSPIAEKITGMKDAGKILSDLIRNHYFTTRHSHANPAYQYHPLFREFLMNRARDMLSSEEINGIRQTSAGILEESGWVDDAAMLFRDSGDMAGLARLILGQAHTLMRQGRNKTLEDWLQDLPREFIEKTPWLLYWMGICRLPFDPAEGRAYCDKAFILFEKQEDFAGALLAWSAVVNTFLHEWDDFKPLDRWIEWLDGYAGKKMPFPSKVVEAHATTNMIGALLWRQVWRRDAGAWAEKAVSTARDSGDINLRIQACVHASTYYTWMGEFAKSQAIIEELEGISRSKEASPLSVLSYKCFKAVISVHSSEMKEQSLQSIEEGLEIAEKSGICAYNHLLFAYGVYCSLQRDDTAMAADFLGSLGKTVDNHRLGMAHYHFLKAWHGLLAGDLSSAWFNAERAVKLVVEAGTPFQESLCRHVMARILHEKGEHNGANKQISVSKRLARKIRSLFFEYVCLLTEATFAMERGDEIKSLKCLRKAMSLGERQGLSTTVCLWPASFISRLCAKALDEGIEVQYVQGLIRKLNLAPPILPDKSPQPPFTKGLGIPPYGKGGIWVENWPWPVKIHTLGKFKILREERPLIFSGKVRKKPLEMLKALIAFGGREVSEILLTDLLWPDADGDAAHSAFKMNLSRLRQLLGINNALQFQEGLLTLDQRYCWTDVWAFERIVDQAERIIERSGDRDKTGLKGEISKLTDRAFSIYGGDFLGDEEEYPWTISLRERLRNRFIRFVSRLGNYFKEIGECKTAMEFYRKGLDTDELSEEFYQGLMSCHHRLGQKAEAIKVYNRCKKILSSVLGVEPSPETENIYSSIFS